MEPALLPQIYYAHSEGQTLVTFSKDGRKIFTTGSDCFVRCFNTAPESRNKDIQTFEPHSEPITSLISTKDSLLTGSEDTTVLKNDIHAPNSVLYKYSQCSTAVRQLAVQPSQPGLRSIDKPFLAIACDRELEIRLTILGTNLNIKLTGLRQPAVSIAFHPDGKTLMALSNQGALVLWDVSNIDRNTDSNRKPFLHSEDKLARCSRPDKDDTACPIAYHPLGNFVAVPGFKAGEVLLVSSQDLTIARTLSQGHQQPVCACAWTPNGQFLATTAPDKQLGIWRVNDWSLCLSAKNESVLTHLAWSPTHNMLVAGNEDGSLVVFEDILTSSHGLSQFDWAYIPYTVADNDSENNGIRVDTPTLSSNVLTLNAKEVPSTLLSPTPRSTQVSTKPPIDSTLISPKIPELPEIDALPPPQSRFQPGASQNLDAFHILLATCNIGTLMLSQEDEYMYTVKFRDIGLSDYTFQSNTKYTIGSLNKNGVILAKPALSGEDTFISREDLERRARIFYRPHGIYESKDTWEVMLNEGEDTQTVTITSLGPLVTTSLGYIRHFSTGGIQFGVFMAPSSTLIASASHEHMVFHAYHISIEVGRLRLGYSIYNLRSKTTVTQGSITLSPSANLTWIGFTEEGLPSLSDSQGLVQVLTPLSEKAAWRPVSKLNPNTHFPISLRKDLVTCIKLDFDWILKLNEDTVEWTISSANTLFDQPDLESQYLMSRLSRDLDNHLNKEDLNPTDLLRRNMIEDKLLLRLLYKACQTDHPKQAIETVMRLNSLESLDYAEQIALRTKHLDVVRHIHDIRKSFKT